MGSEVAPPGTGSGIDASSSGVISSLASRRGGVAGAGASVPAAGAGAGVAWEPALAVAGAGAGVGVLSRAWAHPRRAIRASAAVLEKLGRIGL
jgi:hypothetical protein